MKRTITLLGLLSFLAISHAFSQNLPKDGNRCFSRGKIGKISVKLGYPAVDTYVWGITQDANSVPLGTPISFRRFVEKDRLSECFFIANSEDSLLEWCDYAHPGDLLRVEGRFSGYVGDSQWLVCTRIVFEDREVEGSLVLVQKPKVSLPYVEGLVPCLRTEEGREFILVDKNGYFISCEGEKIVICGEYYSLGSHIKVRGDFSQEYSIGEDLPRFLQIFPQKVEKVSGKIRRYKV